MVKPPTPIVPLRTPLPRVVCTNCGGSYAMGAGLANHLRACPRLHPHPLSTARPQATLNALPPTKEIWEWVTSLSLDRALHPCFPRPRLFARIPPALRVESSRAKFCSKWDTRFGSWCNTSASKAAIAKNGNENEVQEQNMFLLSKC